jgi:hypothetical protein
MEVKYMNVKYGNGKTEYGPGVQIDLDENEIAIAIDAYLVAHNIRIIGARTIKVNDELIESGKIYVDPSGYVIKDGNQYSGRG